MVLFKDALGRDYDLEVQAYAKIRSASGPDLILRTWRRHFLAPEHDPRCPVEYRHMVEGRYSEALTGSSMVREGVYQLECLLRYDGWGCVWSVWAVPDEPSVENKARWESGRAETRDDAIRACLGWWQTREALAARAAERMMDDLTKLDELSGRVFDFPGPSG